MVNNKYLSNLHTIAIILILVCSVIYVYYFILAETYVSVNKKNEDMIITYLKNYTYKMIETSNIREIGEKQGLGDWELYINYKDFSKEKIVLKDDDFYELHSYIRDNGHLAGTKGEIVKYTFIVSLLFLIIHKKR